MRSIEEALKIAGAEDDLQTILQVLEGESVGFSHEAADGPFANMDTAMFRFETQACCTYHKAVSCCVNSFGK